MQDARTLPLPGYVRAQLDEAERVSWKPITVDAGATVMDSELHVGADDARVHYLTFNPAYRDHLPHFLVSAAAKVRRVYEADEEARYVPAVNTRRRLPGEDDAELRRRANLPKRQLDQLSRFLYYGTARQLTSQPVDLRVERQIYGELPEHRGAQLAYLERQLQDLVPHFTTEVEQFAPPRIYRASSGMNVALALGFADIAGARVPSVVAENPYRELGEDLDRLLWWVDEPGLAGDRTAVDTWADRLDLRDWYVWVPHGTTP